MQSTRIYLFLFLCVLSFGNVAKGQGIEYEVSAGPQVTKAIINEFQNGIVNNEKPENNRFLLGYSFSLSARIKKGKLQPGLQLKQDLTRFNVYNLLFWPEDFDSKKQSRWDHIYQAYRLGLGANLRINMSSFFVQPGVSYLVELSSQTKNQFYYGKRDVTEEIEGEEYTSGSGAAGELQLGFKLGKPGNKKFAISLGVQYLFVEQDYTDDLFLHHWTVTPMDFYALFAYRFAKQE